MATSTINVVPQIKKVTITGTTTSEGLLEIPSSYDGNTVVQVTGYYNSYSITGIIYKTAAKHWRAKVVRASSLASVNSADVSMEMIYM